MGGGSASEAIVSEYLKGMFIIIGIVIFFIIIFASAITAFVIKNGNSKENIEQRQLYEKTLNELSPKQREALGL